MTMKNEQDSKSPAIPPLPPATGSVIDESSDAWLVFFEHWFVSEGYAPNPTDYRVLRAWVWFRSGEYWGEHKEQVCAGCCTDTGMWKWCPYCGGMISPNTVLDDTHATEKR